MAVPGTGPMEYPFRKTARALQAWSYRIPDGPYFVRRGFFVPCDQLRGCQPKNGGEAHDKRHPPARGPTRGPHPQARLARPVKALGDRGARPRPEARPAIRGGSRGLRAPRWVGAPRRGAVAIRVGGQEARPRAGGGALKAWHGGVAASSPSRVRTKTLALSGGSRRCGAPGPRAIAPVPSFPVMCSLRHGWRRPPREPT